MNKLIVVAMMAVSVTAFGDDAKPVAAADGALKTADAVVTTKVSDAAKKVDGKALKEKRKAERIAREKAAAEKAGKTVEEYRAERKAMRDQMMAKRLGMSVDEFQKLTPEQRKEKMMAFMKERAAKRAAAKSAKKTNKTEVAPKAE